jgi:hypothetical protein
MGIELIRAFTRVLELSGKQKRPEAVNVMVTTIPCTESNTRSGECIGHLNARFRASHCGDGGYWQFFCGECGRAEGTGKVFPDWAAGGKSQPDPDPARDSERSE